MNGQLTTWADAHAFVFAGNATFTLVSKATGTRFTYKVRKKLNAQGPHVYFVSLLRGADNESDYAYMGVIDHNGFRWTTKSRVGKDAASHKAFAWFLQKMQADGSVPEALEVWHEGRCGRCGRKLTVPESVAQGLGPECSGRMEAA